MFFQSLSEPKSFYAQVPPARLSTQPAHNTHNAHNT
ncbi:unnamed protein product [Ectocarpus sp. 6 AP-2014]